MGRSEQRAKSSKMAGMLIRAGYPHGRRRSRPAPNSGGLSMVNRAGSSRYQRRIDRGQK